MQSWEQAVEILSGTDLVVCKTNRRPSFAVREWPSRIRWGGIPAQQTLLSIDLRIVNIHTHYYLGAAIDRHAGTGVRTEYEVLSVDVAELEAGPL